MNHATMLRQHCNAVWTSADQSGSPASVERQEQLVQQTRQEHDALLVVMHQLEAALAAAAPNRERSWNQRVLDSVGALRRAWEDHVVSAEGPAGLFAEIDLCRPTLMRRVQQLREEHVRLGEHSAALFHFVEQQHALPMPNFDVIRRRAMSLLNALRQHQAAEADLIFESFFTDIGAGD